MTTKVIFVTLVSIWKLIKSVNLNKYCATLSVTKLQGEQNHKICIQLILYFDNNLFQHFFTILSNMHFQAFLFYTGIL